MILKALLLFISIIPASAQTTSLRGKVTDSRTGQPLVSANVYINRTTLGSETDENGNFFIDNIVPGNFELICSMVGYGTVNIRTSLIEVERKEINISLKQVETKLSEITVTAKKDKKWERNLKIFTKAFLGKDDISKNCKIQNPEVLEFTPLGDHGLGATASAPLVIINNSLGYKVRYQLTHFEQFPKRFTIAGNVLFQPLTTTDSILLKQWVDNREKIYRESPVNFYRALITNRLAKKGYDTYVEKQYGTTLKRSTLFADIKPYIKRLEPQKFITQTDSGTFSSTYVRESKFTIKILRTALSTKTCGIR